ncbi:Pseudouridine synthase [Venustampulla echinocandica]|uniref:Pseudouridine synthase n=1 Tax=Venustampulla echinocandica TaxID=2656787 RepID=A0A370U0E5_9HELO|nr:Pseudouridine synthase [Venustampulla echinocandica]RDL41246.1 Pseudouridine synthase [Venustampulla echinocandica]
MDYTAWSHDSLVERVAQLETELKSKNRGSTPTPAPRKKSWKKPRHDRAFDPAKYHTRLIALKLAYLGKNYNGFEHHIDTPLSTIEEELWKALNRARLIFPKDTDPLNPGEVNWDGLEYSKCGRTDKGVSAFGQVIGIRVRSNRPLAQKKKSEASGQEGIELVEGQREQGHADAFKAYPGENGVEIRAPPLGRSPRGPHVLDSEPLNIHDPALAEALNFDHIADEIPYCYLLNRLLPPDIRILAWCPAPPTDFSARFSCRERRYKYFFTNPAFPPIPHNLEFANSGKGSGKIKDGWLDIGAMQEAAKLFEGTHDFRNFCKVDASKQISNFERMIYHADISSESAASNKTLGFLNDKNFIPEGFDGEAAPQIYTFNLHGSAFLWHQVRHIVAILFLVGQGLEPPSIVSELLDIAKTPGRPTYEMATDTPLVLWDCIFPRQDDPTRQDALQWIYVGDGVGNAEAKYAAMGLVDVLWEVWREKKIDEVLAGSLLDIVQRQGGEITDLTLSKKPNRSQKVFHGADRPRLQGTYQPVMKKHFMESVDFINDRYAMRKGFENAEDLKRQGYRTRNKAAVEEAENEFVEGVE